MAHAGTPISVPELGQMFSSRAIRHGDYIFVSGQAAGDGKGGVVGVGDLERQTRAALEKIETVLQAAGADMSDIIKTTVFMTDISQRQVVNDVRREIFGDRPPVSTMVQVAALAKPEYMIEIDAIAAVPAGSTAE